MIKIGHTCIVRVVAVMYWSKADMTGSAYIRRCKTPLMNAMCDAERSAVPTGGAGLAGREGAFSKGVDSSTTNHCHTPLNQGRALEFSVYAL